MLTFDSSAVDATSSPRRAWIDRIAWFGAAALLLFYAAMLWSFAVDWPLHDDYTQILAIPGYLAQLPALGEKLAVLFALALEHRAATVRLFGWFAAALPGGIDFRALIFVGNAMAVAAGALVVLWYPTRFRPFAALLAALLVTSITHYAAQYHATGALQHFGVSFYGLAAMSALARGHRLLVPAMMGSLATLTSVSGLLVFPAAVLLLTLSGRRREAIVWAVAGAIVAALYFVGYEAAGGARGLASVLDRPLALLSFVLATLGCIGEGFVTSSLIGALVAIVWVVLAASGAWKRVPPVVIAAAVLLALTCALVAFGRAVHGAEAVTLSRYRMYSALLVLLTIAALAWTMTPLRVLATQAAAIGGAAVLAAVAWLTVLPSFVHLHLTQRTLRNHFAGDGHGHHAPYTREFGDFTLNRARELGFYAARLRAAPPTAVVAAVAGNGPANVPALRAEVYPGERVLSVAGWMFGRHGDVSLWLGNGDRLFRAQLQDVRYRAGPRAERWTAFHGSVDVSAMPRGRYRLGYTVDDATAVAWTTKSVDLDESAGWRSVGAVETALTP